MANGCFSSASSRAFSIPWFSLKKRLKRKRSILAMEHVRLLQLLEETISFCFRCFIFSSSFSLHRIRHNSCYLLTPTHHLTLLQNCRRTYGHMDYPKQSIGNPALLLLFFAGVFYLFIWSSSYRNPFLAFQKEPICTFSNTTTIYAPQDDLEEALSKASMANKTVIITVVNRAYVEQDIKADTTMLDLFLESFWLGEDTRPLLDHLLIVAVDQTAYDRCLFRRLNCYRLKTDGVDFRGEKIYMSDDFIKMMWRRTHFLLDVLNRGYNFIFTDTDIMWLRNPFVRLSKNESEDLQISTDIFIADPWPEKQLINTGFYYVRSNNKTIALLNTWYAMKDNSTGQKEQDVLLNLIRGGIVRELNLSVRFLDTLHFSGFCQDSKDFRAVTTVHANCCRSINAKVNDLKAVLRDWKRFKKYSSYRRLANVTANLAWSGHFGCWNSWRVDTKPIG